MAEGSGTLLQFVSPPADELQKLRDTVSGMQSRIKEPEDILLGARQSNQTITDEGGGIDGTLVGGIICFPSRRIGNWKEDTYCNGDGFSQNRSDSSGVSTDACVQEFDRTARG